ncbi:MAG: LysM peptidoglycan-binding domain-containing protein [Anaerolineae bacterium]|jgi:nucleoid-associated protein YgaU
MGSLQDEMKDLKRREPRYYVVKAGDSLSKIAKELLGDADRWPEIVAANKDRIDDPNAIEPGLKLKVPS